MSNYSSHTLGASYNQIEVDISEVENGLNDFNVRTKRALWKYLEQDACPMLRNYMRAEHPWKNRTGTAELGLDAKVVKSGNMKRDDYSLGVELSHSAYNKGFPYGVSLEYGAFNHRTGRYNKPYPILEPTARTMYPKVVEDMQGIVDLYG